MTTVTGARAADHAARLDVFCIAIVTTVTAWKHGVSLGFNDSALAINIEGGAELRLDGTTEAFAAGEDRSALAKRLLDFLGRHVVSAAVAADGALTLAFETVDLILRPDPSGYESYVIFLPDETTLVG